MSHARRPETTSPDPVLTAERAHLRARRRLPDRDAGRRRRRSPTPASTPGRPSGWAPPAPTGCASLAADPDVPAFFGRIDTAGPARAETFHIGRRHVRDDAGDPVVIDWRAPMSRPFYQASAADPQGVVRRRRFGFAGGELTGYEDELLGDGAAGGRRPERACCAPRSSARAAARCATSWPPSSPTRTTSCGRR